MKFMEQEGVDEALRLTIVEAWHKVQEELELESKKSLN